MNGPAARNTGENARRKGEITGSAISGRLPARPVNSLAGRLAAILLALGAVLLLGAEIRPKPPTRLSPEEAAKQGRALVARILSLRPAQDVTNTGVLKIRKEEGGRTEIPVKFEITALPTRWSSSYEAGNTSNGVPEVKLAVVHRYDRPNLYHLTQNGETKTLSGNETMIPFAGSDFWVADLGLEFLHWPDQRLIKKEMRRGQACDVLESFNPHPVPGAYSRVVSWVDRDSGGIINAEAYDSRGKILKEFIAKSVKKVRGQWEVQEVEMDNDQTGSRTWIKFDLGSGH